MKGGGLRLGVIVGSIVAVAAAVMVVIMIVLAVVRKRKCTKKVSEVEYYYVTCISKQTPFP